MIYFLKKYFERRVKLYNCLKTVYGLNKFRILNICLIVGCKPFINIDRISFLKLRLMEKIIFNLLAVDRYLTKERKTVLDILVKTGFYRGIRLKQGLPVRGQRTHSNARTNKYLYKLNRK
jgi:small subunit ribosomal protein S13